MSWPSDRIKLVGTGRVFVYRLSGQNWTQLGTDIPGEASNDLFGTSVALSSDGLTLAVGATGNDGNGTSSGHVRVFRFDGNDWVQLGTDIDGEAAEDRFGLAVSLSADGNRLAVGAPSNSENGISSGHVRVFQYTGTTWLQLGDDIDGSTLLDDLGVSVSLSSSGTMVAVGASGNDDNGDSSGQTKVFRYTAGNWSQVGNDINGTQIQEFSGQKVSLSADGSRIAISAPFNDMNGIHSGRVTVYQLGGSGNWQQLGEALPGEAADDRSGSAISLSASGEILAIGASENDGNGFRAGHTRVYQFFEGQWVQLGPDLDGSAAIDLSGAGVSLSADGRRLAVGAPGNDGNGNASGRVQVFDLSNLILTLSEPIQLGQDLDGAAAADFFGIAAAISDDGTIVAAGANGNDDNGSFSGHTRIFQLAGGQWTQMGADIDGEAATDFSGRAVALSAHGNIVAIGANGNDGNGSASGHVRVYQFNGNSWIQMGGDINGESSDDNSGFSVDLSADGTILAIGATGNDDNANNSGHVRVYQFAGNNWTQLGADIDGAANNDRSGISVSLSADGSILAIGANGHDGSNGFDSGHVRVFSFSGGAWSQIGSDIDGEADGDGSGVVVDLSHDGTVLAIGANGNDGNGTRSGHVRVYQFDAQDWLQLGSDIDGEAAEDRFGTALSLSGCGRVLAVGAIFNDGGGSNSGHTRILVFDGNDWKSAGIDIDGEAIGDEAGYSVALSKNGTVVAIGARHHDGNGNQSGQVRIYDLSAMVEILPLDLTVQLQGPFYGIGMHTGLQGQLPLRCPFSVVDFPELINPFATLPNPVPNDYVDWMLVSLMKDETTVVRSIAAVLLSDGTIVKPGGSRLAFTGMPPAEYFVSIRHRNHLGVMTGQKLFLTPWLFGDH